MRRAYILVDVAKEQMNARIGGSLRRAVATKAAERGETVTDVITRAFEAYIRDDEAAGIASAPPVAEASVYTEPGWPPRDEPACRHPAEAVEAGECGICHADVW